MKAQYYLKLEFWCLEQLSMGEKEPQIQQTQKHTLIVWQHKQTTDKSVQHFFSFQSEDWETREVSQEVRAAEPPGRGTWEGSASLPLGVQFKTSCLWFLSSCSGLCIGLVTWVKSLPLHFGTQHVIRRGSWANGLYFRVGTFRQGNFGRQPRFWNVCALPGY